MKSGMMPEKDLDVSDLACHDRLGHAGRLEQLDALAELAERDPVQRRAGLPGRLLQVGEGFLLDGDDDDLVTEITGALQCEKRKLAVAGDEADACH